MKPIDKVTTPLLYNALKTVGVNIHIDLIDKVIDVVELLEDKGEGATLKDLISLRKKWAGLTDSNS